MRISRIKSFVAAAMTMSLVLAPAPSHATDVVVDPTNLVQNVLQAVRALEQIHNQITAIEQQAQMLSHNPLQLSPELTQSISEARELFSTAQGLAFQADRLSDDLRLLYPETWAEFDLGEIGERSAQWLREDRTAVERSMAVQANAVQSIQSTQGRVDRALQSSSDAEGQTGVGQATNQLLGINAAQLAEIETLLVAQSRALDTERMERVARETRAREVHRRAFPTTVDQALDPARSAF